jgi:hypothetical protein
MYTIAYRVERDDWLELLSLVQWRIHGYRSKILFAISGVAIVALNEALTLCKSCQLDGKSLTVGMFLALFLMFATMALQRLAVKGMPKEEGFILGAKNLSASSEGVVETGAHYKFIISWMAIEAVTVSTTIVVLWTGRGGGLIIPRTAFAEKASERAFLSFVNSQMALASTSSHSNIIPR